MLAPDSIYFEDRRRNRTGTEPDEAGDVQQHYDEMSYRLVQGDTLMRKILDDAQRGISVRQHPDITRERIALLGHSSGGTTTLFQATSDDRVSFACASGPAGSYRAKITHGIGLEVSLVIPGFARSYDLHDVIRCTAPKPLLVVSGIEDKATLDADQVVAQGREAYTRRQGRTSVSSNLYRRSRAFRGEIFRDR